jgi:hypothetical protein
MDKYRRLENNGYSDARHKKREKEEEKEIAHAL